MNTPVLSIIIPIYNVENYITECIKSLLEFPKFLSIECILVDDCGQDNSMDIVNSILQEYSGAIEFKIIHHSKNKGLSSARNTGLRVALGQYVFFYDSDDHINSQGLTQLINIAITTQADIIVGDYIEYFENEKKEDGTVKAIPAKLGDSYKGESFFKRFHKPLTSVVWRNLYRRDFLSEHNLFFHVGVYFEDLEFTPLAFYYAKSVVYTGTFFYYYRKRSNSITTSQVSEKKVKDLVLIWAELDKVVNTMSNQELKTIFTEIGAFSFLNYYKTYARPLERKYLLMIKSFSSHLVRSIKYKLFWRLFRILPQNIILWILTTISKKDDV